jgi:hypothetical protein
MYASEKKWLLIRSSSASERLIADADRFATPFKQTLAAKQQKRAKGNPVSA